MCYRPAYWFTIIIFWQCSNRTGMYSWFFSWNQFHEILWHWQIIIKLKPQQHNNNLESSFESIVVLTIRESCCFFVGRQCGTEAWFGANSISTTRDYDQKRKIVVVVLCSRKAFWPKSFRQREERTKTKSSLKLSHYYYITNSHSWKKKILHEFSWNLKDF